MITVPVFSQKYKKDLEKADVLFYGKKYGEAYIAYQQIYKKYPEKDILLKMADLNFVLPNYAVAQDYYAKYFSDTVYKDMAQFANYALASKQLGKVKLASKLYQKIYENKQDTAAKRTYELFKIFSDSSEIVRSYYLDSSYTCVVLDARESMDSLAMPLAYIWNLGDGVVTEGDVIEHCFRNSGWNKISLSVRDLRTGIVHSNDTAVMVYVETPPVKFKTPRTGKQYIDVEFDGGQTLINDHNILEYVWDLGNGETLRGKKVKYKYNVKGIYKIKLYVIAENTSGGRRLFSSYKMIEIVDNYSKQE